MSAIPKIILNSVPTFKIPKKSNRNKLIRVGVFGIEPIFKLFKLDENTEYLVIVVFVKQNWVKYIFNKYILILKKTNNHMLFYSLYNKIFSSHHSN